MTEFLRTTSFPLLNELSITCGEDWSGEEVTDLSNSIIALGPQLLSFSFTSIGSDFTTVLLPEVWPALTSVQHLTLHHNDNLPDILPLVRSSLVSFRLRAPVDEIEDMEFNFGALLEALAEPPAALNTLQHLTIPPIDPDYEREEEDDADDPLASSLQVVQTICRHRGIKISYAPDQRHARFMEHIEDEVSLT
ncbi:hypothetical protein BCR35DRAFT_298075 [Leucosporidium creatinivorum]|uniref:F-box domain-containing protein n=1 Tax=Leucosporidium creatinivorum TaxID=106004 RepID=A0A1Y2G3V5_9BASI|nr:hypothetical protein BCR35DRAFT_298075 [Leucosporidium creatinivorum]